MADNEFPLHTIKKVYSTADDWVINALLDKGWHIIGKHVSSDGHPLVPSQDTSYTLGSTNPDVDIKSLEIEAEEARKAARYQELKDSVHAPI